MKDLSSIKLETGTYDEVTLVDLICTDAQKKTYYKRNKFAGGKQRSSFLDTLSRCCEYEYDVESKTYNIQFVYEYPKMLQEAKIHKGIYQYIAPLILFNVLYGEDRDGRRSVITSLNLAQTVNLINSNYGVVKSYQDKAQEIFELPYSVLMEFFNKAEDSMDNYIRRCVKYLAYMNCVIYNEVHMIGIIPKTAKINNGEVIIREPEIRTATEDEMKLYARLVDKATKESKIYSEKEKWYGAKSNLYLKKLNRLLKKHGIAFVCKAFELYRVNGDRCKEILSTFNDMTINERRVEVGKVMKMIMDDNAEERYRKNADKYGPDYIEQFKKLSDITMPYDAESIFTLLCDNEDRDEDFQDRMQSRYGFTIKYKKLKEMPNEK